MPREARSVDVAKSKESETDYSYLDTHLEPKLRLSQRSKRSIERASGGALGGALRGRRAAPPPRITTHPPPCVGAPRDSGASLR